MASSASLQCFLPPSPHAAAASSSQRRRARSQRSGWSRGMLKETYRTGEDRWKSDEPPSLYIFINSSTCDLASIEKYVDKFATSVPALLFNLELDTLSASAPAGSMPSSSPASASEVSTEWLEPRVEQRDGGYWVLKEKYRTGLNP
nr:unnamed protein product [Digitaria exilis]